MVFSDPEYISVVIIGGGQAGLAASYCLRKRGVDDHVIFERHRIGASWRMKRWDSFQLVTPNHQCQLPGHPYDGDDPHGFMTGDEVAGYIDRYAKKFRPPVLEGVSVKSITKQDGYFHVVSDLGSWYCDDVVVAIGGSQVPYIPAGAGSIPDRIQQFTPWSYKRPSQLPEGATLIVGSGQSGAQILEELHRAGREVHLCLGNSPRAPRRYRGRDLIEWMEEMGLHRMTVRDEGTDQDLFGIDPYLTTSEIDLRQLAREGVGLHGFVEAIDFEKFTVRPDVAAKLDHADRAFDAICRRIDSFIEERQIAAPQDSHEAMTWSPDRETTELSFAEHNITSIIWCTGYLPDFKFIDLPVFNMRGFPETERGVTSIPGLYFLGLPWMHSWGSARFSGIAEDADHVAAKIEASISQPITIE